MINLSSSIGISIFPRDGESSVELMRAADKARNEAKKQRGSYLFYTGSLHKKATQRIRLIGQLRAALKNGEFKLLYQPIIDSRGRLVAAEALLRWHSPEEGSVPALEFIPVLEETGLIVPVGHWILKTACREAALWHDAGFSFQVYVNLSVKQFHDQGLEECVSNALSETGLPAEKLGLEITESLLFENIEGTLSRLTYLQNMGVSFALDDFGTGFSSLSYLKDLPVNTLKIDKYFIQGIPQSAEDAAIVSSVISMAKGLGLKLVAEGVEKQEQLEYLLSGGCDRIQGFIYSPPIESKDLLSYAENVPSLYSET